MLRALTLLITIMTLAACGNGGGGGSAPPAGQGAAPPPATQTIVVTASLGRIRNATVVVTELDGTPIDGATGVLDDTGSVVLDLPADFTGPLRVEVQGDADAEYFDEATGTFRPFGAGRRLRAVLSAPQDVVGVTLLTDLAASMLDGMASPTAADIDQANESVRTLLAPDVTDITQPPTVIDDSSGAGSLAGDDAGRYAALLAALAKVGAGSDAPALAVLDQLRADIADGSLDDLADGTPLDPASVVASVTDGSLASALDAGLQSVLTEFAADDLDATDFASGNGLPAGGSSGGGQPANFCFAGDPGPITIPAAFQRSYEVTFTGAGPNAPFSDGTMKTFTVSSAGALSIDGVLISDQPVGCGGNPHEVAWLDATTQLVYALSDLQAQFNEINVNAAGPGGEFFGQFREPAPAVNTALQTLIGLAGTYMPVVVSSCAAQSICPSSLAVGDTLPVTVNADGSVLIEGMTLDPNATDSTVTDFTTGTTQPRVELQGAGAQPGETFTVRIFLEADSPVAFELEHAESCGDGCSQSSAVYAESRPVSMDVSNFFADVVARSPIALTVVADDPGFNGKVGFAIGVPFGESTLCLPFTLTGRLDQAAVPQSTFRPAFSYVFGDGGNGGDDYQRRYSRFASDPTAMTRTLSFFSSQLVLSDTSVALEEGLVNPATGVITTVRDRASNDPAVIDAACGSMGRVSGTVDFTGNGAITLELVDTASATTLGSRQVFGGTSAPGSFVFAAPIGTMFEVRVSDNGGLTCQLTGATGSVSATEASVSVTCAP